MAGFRIGRGGRDNRPPRQPQQQGQQRPRHSSGREPSSSRSTGTDRGREDQQGYGQGQPPYRQAPQPRQDEPEYFGDPYYQGQGQGQPQGYAPAQDPYANNPGHTQAFSIGEDPYGDGATYRAGAATVAPSGPRLHWKELLSGIVMRPGPTFWQMRDHPVWGPALIVTFLYGLLAIFGFDKAREDVISTALSKAPRWSSPPAWSS